MSEKQIRIVAIIGAGTMGRRIAFDCVRYGRETRLFDATDGVVERATQWIEERMREHVERGDIDDQTRRRAMAVLIPCTTIEQAASGADIAIENVPERVELKRAVFAQLDALLPLHALLGTNTSSIPGSWLADATAHPERIFNANFGHLGHAKVELMGHAGTSPETMARAERFLRELGFIPIVVRRESVGYASNRVWRAVKKEVLELLDRGVATPADIDRGWMLDWHVPIGPCALMDKIGLDVVRDIELIYFQASGDERDRPPALLDRLIAEGKTGEKSGEGFYRYPNPAYLAPDFLQGTTNTD